MTNADVVLSALRSFASGDQALAPIADLAALTELTEAQIRRALRELCDDGRIQPDGKSGRITVFRLLDSDSGHDGGVATRRDSPPSGEESSSSSSTTTDRPMADEPTQPVVSAGKVVTALEGWIRNAGLYCDRESEVEAELYGTVEEDGHSWGGLIRRMTTNDAQLRASLLADPELKARLLALWRERRPTGEKLEQAQIERADHWKAARRRLGKDTSTVAPATASLLREMPEPDLGDVLTDLATTKRNGNTDPDHDDLPPTPGEWDIPDY